MKSSNPNISANNPLIKSSFLSDNQALHSEIAQLRDKIEVREGELKDLKKVLIQI